MNIDKTPISQDVIDVAKKMGFIHSDEIDRVFYLIVDDKTEEEIEEIKSKAELSGFFFNGFAPIHENTAIEFVYNN